MMALVVDPGGTIGWVTAEILMDSDPAKGFRIVKWGETKKHFDWLTQVFDAMLMETYAVLILENYGKRDSVKSWQPDAMHQIGALLWMAEHFGVPVSLQGVGGAMEFATPLKLADFAEVGRGKNPETGQSYEGHARMALKHLIWWRWNRWR